MTFSVTCQNQIQLVTNVFDALTAAYQLTLSLPCIRRTTSASPTTLSRMDEHGGRIMAAEVCSCRSLQVLPRLSVHPTSGSNILHNTLHIADRSIFHGGSVDSTFELLVECL